MIFIVVSTGHFDPLLKACEKLKDRYAFLGQIGMGSFVPSFEHFRTAPPKVIEEKMRKAELVISHGGTGMLSMLYRLKKRAVVIPKQIRYGEANDGQVELARKWGELGMATFCLDVEEIGQAIEACRKSEPIFPVFPSVGKAFRREWGMDNDALAAVGSGALS